MCEPAGLSSPAIFAFFIKISEIADLYPEISDVLLVESILSRYPSTCLSKSCISAEYTSVWPSRASWISVSSFAILSLSPDSLLL